MILKCFIVNIYMNFKRYLLINIKILYKSDILFCYIT